MWKLRLLCKLVMRWAKRSGYGYVDFTFIGGDQDYMRLVVKNDIHDKTAITDSYTFDSGKTWKEANYEQQAL